MGVIGKGYAPLRLIKSYTQFSSLTDLIVKNRAYKFAIIPFTLLYGAINATESGYKPYNATPTDYTSFTKVFDGKESVIVEWDNSVILTADKTNNKWIKDLQVGTSIAGYLVDDSASVQFNSATIDQSFQEESVVRTFTFQVSSLPTLQDDGTWKEEIRPVSNDDLFKFYQILEIADESPISDKIIGNFNKTNLTNRQWFYITNVVNYYSPKKKFVYSSITFSSVNDKLAKTGYAIDQYIHIGGPGEGSAFPTLDSQKNIVVSDILSKDLPITHMQIDFFGNNSPSNIVAWGRPANSNEITANGYTKSIIAPRLLFKQNFLAPIQDPLKYNNTPSRNLVVLTGDVGGKGNYFDINSSYENWQKNLAALIYNNLQEKEFEGALGSNFTNTSANLYAAQDDGTKRYTSAFWDSVLVFALQGVYDVKANPYFSHPIDASTNLTPNESIDYSKITDMSLSKLLMMNYFMNIAQEVVPKDSRETTFYTLSSIPIIGGFLNKITGGLPLGFRSVSNADWPATPPLNTLLDGSLYWFIEKTLFNQATPSATSGFIPVDVFRDDESNQLSGLLGANATTISFCASLSDQITAGVYDLTTKGRVGDYTGDTSQLGQNPNRNGTIDNNQIVLVEPASKVLPTNNEDGYLIDAVEFKTFGKCDYKITFYSGTPSPDNSNAVWMGYYSTYAKQTKNINNWTNRVVLSNYSLTGKYRDSNTTFNYPQNILFPNAPNQKTTEWDVGQNFLSVLGRGATITIDNPSFEVPINRDMSKITLPRYLQNELNAGNVKDIIFNIDINIAATDELATPAGRFPQTYSQIEKGLISAKLVLDTNNEYKYVIPYINGIRFQIDGQDSGTKLDFDLPPADAASIILFKDTDNLWKVRLNGSWFVNYSWYQIPTEPLDNATIDTLKHNLTLNSITFDYN